MVLTQVTHGYTWLHMVTELGRPLKRTPVIFVVRRVRQSGSVFLVFEYCEHDVGALSLGSSIHPAWRQMALHNWLVVTGFHGWTMTFQKPLGME